MQTARRLAAVWVTIGSGAGIEPRMTMTAPVVVVPLARPARWMRTFAVSQFHAEGVDDVSGAGDIVLDPDDAALVKTCRSPLMPRAVRLGPERKCKAAQPPGLPEPGSREPNRMARMPGEAGGHETSVRSSCLPGRARHPWTLTGFVGGPDVPSNAIVGDRLASVGRATR